MANSLLEPEPLPPRNPWVKRIVVLVLVLAVLGALAYWNFRYYREERLVRQFMDALVAGNYQKAYRIWNPMPTYTYTRFLEDWGETTSYGRVRSYQIVDIRPSPGLQVAVPIDGGRERRTLHVGGESSGVIVTVRINGREPTERLWVETNPPRLSFPPF